MLMMWLKFFGIVGSGFAVGWLVAWVIDRIFAVRAEEYTRGFRAGEDDANDFVQARLKEFDVLVAQYRAQRDEAHARTAAAHVERDKALAWQETLQAKHDGLMEMNRRLLDRNKVVDAERDVAVAECKRLGDEVERLARAHQAFTDDLTKMWHAGRTVVERASAIEERMAGFTVAAGGEEPIDDEEDDADTVSRWMACVAGDQSDDDVDVDDLCPDCGADLWTDCDCDDSDIDDLDDDDDEDS